MAPVCVALVVVVLLALAFLARPMSAPPPDLPACGDTFEVYDARTGTSVVRILQVLPGAGGLIVYETRVLGDDLWEVRVLSLDTWAASTLLWTREGVRTP